MAAIDWAPVRALTFDCYGTLVDWERGIARDLRAALAGAERFTDAQLLDAYGAAEQAAEAGEFRAYKDVLRDALARVAKSVGAAIRDPEALVAGLPSWPVFEDTPGALRRLQRRFRLCVVSNVDRDLFAETERAIGVRFDEVVTADQVRSYKPARAHFDEALKRLALETAHVVHVAQSLFHDVATAQRLGLRAVWVDRRGARTGRADAVPDLRVSSLAELADAVERSRV